MTTKAADVPDVPEFPKAMVRVRARAHGVYEPELRLVGDAAGEAAATADDYTAVPLPPSSVAVYPCWVYHADGRRQIVSGEAEREALGAGFEDAPVTGPAEPAPEPVASGPERNTKGRFV